MSEKDNTSWTDWITTPSPSPSPPTPKATKAKSKKKSFWDKWWVKLTAVLLLLVLCVICGFSVNRAFKATNGTGEELPPMPTKEVEADETGKESDGLPPIPEEQKEEPSEEPTVVDFCAGIEGCIPISPPQPTRINACSVNDGVASAFKAPTIPAEPEPGKDIPNGSEVLVLAYTESSHYDFTPSQPGCGGAHLLLVKYQNYQTWIHSSTVEGWAE